MKACYGKLKLIYCPSSGFNGCAVLDKSLHYFEIFQSLQKVAVVWAPATSEGCHEDQSQKDMKTLYKVQSSVDVKEFILSASPPLAASP